MDSRPSMRNLCVSGGRVTCCATRDGFFGWLVGVVLGLLEYLQRDDELRFRLVHELRQLPK